MMKMECTCSQKIHTAPVECIEVSAGAIEKVVDILANYNSIFMVADENTYEVAGKRVEQLLKEAGIDNVVIGSALIKAEDKNDMINKLKK